MVGGLQRLFDARPMRSRHYLRHRQAVNSPQPTILQCFRGVLAGAGTDAFGFAVPPYVGSGHTEVAFFVAYSLN